MLDLSSRAEIESLARLLSAARDASQDTPILVVGATARDLLLHYGHGVAVARATNDVDLALAVADWDSFQGVQQALIDSGRFEAGGSPHQFRFEGTRVDILPFGGIEREDRSIAWPPDGGVVMNVLGFKEAMATAIAVRLPDGAEFPVASLAAQAVLKVCAWNERGKYATSKDADDLWLLVSKYAICLDETRLWVEEAALMESLGYDQELAGAHLLGRDARRVLETGVDGRHALETLQAILAPETDPEGALRLLSQMPGSHKDRQLSTLDAFCKGLLAYTS